MKRDVPRSRELYDALVGRRSGIVRRVRLPEAVQGDAPLYHAAAEIANAIPDRPLEADRFVGGSSITPQQALCVALYEGLERYLASAYCRGPVQLQPASELPWRTGSPATLAQFSPQQRRQPGFPFVEATLQTPLRWELGKRLSDGAPYGVPAFAVFLPYEPALGEPLIGPGISTGLACGESLSSAVLAGLCEVVERDSLALTWLRGMSPPRIPATWLSEHANDLLPTTDEVHAYDLTSDLGLPVALVVCRGRGPRGPLLSVGSACHPDARRAARKAALEASAARVYVRQLLELQPHWRPLPDFSNVTDFSLHARLYSAAPDLVDRGLDFLLKCTGESEFPTQYSLSEQDSHDPLGYVVRRLRHAGHDPAYVNLTTDWAIALGLHVVKVVVPTLMPLHGHHGLAYLGHTRLAQACKAMPQCVVLHSHSLWPYPHPFP